MSVRQDGEYSPEKSIKSNKDLGSYRLKRKIAAFDVEDQDPNNVIMKHILPNGPEGERAQRKKWRRLARDNDKFNSLNKQRCQELAEQK